ncbi:MAG: hypothetical protein IPF50_11530 [Proteobacteria bacterium]|nr:hypothetical protein [Pseudomonadota bacterium]
MAEVEFESTPFRQTRLAVGARLECQRTGLPIERQSKHLTQGVMCRQEAAAIVVEQEAPGAAAFVVTEDRGVRVEPVLIEIEMPEFDISRQIVRNWFDAAGRHARTLHGPQTRTS